MEFEFKGDGTMRYANNSMYRGDGIIRKKGELTRHECLHARLHPALVQQLYPTASFRKCEESFVTVKSWSESLASVVLLAAAQSKILARFAVRMTPSGPSQMTLGDKKSKLKTAQLTWHLLVPKLAACWTSATAMTPKASNRSTTLCKTYAASYLASLLCTSRYVS